MELIRGLNGLRPRHRPCVATIGAFDGIHEGHRAVIQQLREQGTQHALPTTVVTFEPLPREYLAAEEAPARLQSFRERCAALSALGVDQLLCLRFNEALRSMSAEAFARDIFIDGLAVRSLVLGDDFRFGKEREGGATLMRRLGEAEGFSTFATRTVSLDGERISSTRLRGALANSDFALVRRLLGRDYAIEGRVIYGKQLGRELGAPTANLALRRRSLPLRGVFAVRVDGGDLHGAAGIANVGTRPTVSAGTRPNLEVHILHGEHALYGQRIRVTFCHKLRDEQRFDSLAALQARIHTDIDSARAWFASYNKDA